MKGKTRIYESPCPGCRKQARSDKTVLGVPDGDYEDYPLRRITITCEYCKTRFTVHLNPDVPEIQAQWEAGEDMR